MLLDVSENLDFRNSNFTVEIIALMKKAASTSETSLHFYLTIHRNTPEDSQLQTRLTYFKVDPVMVRLPMNCKPSSSAISSL